MVHPTKAYFSMKEPPSEGCMRILSFKWRCIFSSYYYCLVFLLPSLFQREGRKHQLTCLQIKQEANDVPCNPCCNWYWQKVRLIRMNLNYSQESSKTFSCYVQARSKRSRFITLFQAAMKSWTNFSFESALP